MDNFFKNWNFLDIIMVICAFVAMVTCAVDGNILAAIWAFNTLMWVGISKTNNDKAKDWQDKYDEVSIELRDLKNKLKDVK